MTYASQAINEAKRANNPKAFHPEILITGRGLCKHLLGGFENLFWQSGQQVPLAECQACNKYFMFSFDDKKFVQIMQLYYEKFKTI